MMAARRSAGSAKAKNAGARAGAAARTAIATPLGDSGGLVLVVADPRIISLECGEVLFSEGDPAACLYILCSGALRIRIEGVVYEDVQPGGVVGEMGLVEKQRPRSATVTALADSKLIEIEEQRFFLSWSRKRRPSRSR